MFIRERNGQPETVPSYKKTEERAIVKLLIKQDAMPPVDSLREAKRICRQKSTSSKNYPVFGRRQFSFRVFQALDT